MPDRNAVLVVTGAVLVLPVELVDLDLIAVEEEMPASGKGVPAGTLRPVPAPDRVENRLGTLEFNDGAPAKSMAGLLYDHFDFVYEVEAFPGAFPARP